MERVLVSGYIGFNNFGDEAIFKALSSHLLSSGYKVSVLSDKHYENITSYKRFSILKAILNCDILISGGGSLLQNKTSNLSLLYYLFIIFLAKLCFKKVIIFAQGIEPIKGKFFEYITRFILNICDFISLRDEKSQKLLNSWNIKSTLLSDPVYSIVKTNNTDKCGLLIQLREVKGIKKEFISDLAFVISKYFDNVSLLVLQEEYDKKICSDFINEFNKLAKCANCIYNEDIDKTIETINSFEYVISTRLHGLIVSAASGCKTFAISYDEKTETLINELNIANINIYDYTRDELDEKLKLFFNSPYQKYKYRNFSWDELDKELSGR